jgi:hypothetical protein
VADEQLSIEERISAAVSNEPSDQGDPIVGRIQAINSPEESVDESIPEESEDESVPEESEDPVDDSEEEPDIAAEDSDETVLESLGDLAGYLGVEVSELYNVSIPITGADGSKKEVTLGEWKDSYQLSEQAQETQRRAQEEYEALSSKITELDEFQQQAAVQTQSYIQAAQQELTQDFNQVNWEQLRAEDPGKYAVMRQDFIERNARLQQMGQAADQQWRQTKQQIDQQREAQIGQFVQREQRALSEAIPEWRNEEAALAEKAKIADYLLSLGYRQSDLNQVYDHRLVVLARNAMKWQETQKQATAAKKKVVKVGKTPIKGTARRSKGQNKANRERDLRIAMRKGGGKVEDAAAIIQSRVGR